MEEEDGWRNRGGKNKTPLYIRRFHVFISRFSRWVGTGCASASANRNVHYFRRVFLNSLFTPRPRLFKSSSINIYIAPLPAFSDPDPHFSDNTDRPPGARNDSTLHGPENLLLFSWIVPRVTTSTPGGIIVRISSG